MKNKVHIRVGCYADKFIKEGDKYVVNWDTKGYKKLIDRADDFIFSADNIAEGLLKLAMINILNKGLVKTITIDEREDKWV